MRDQAPTSVRLARHPNDAVGRIRTLRGGHRGRIREALVTINQALASADRGGERYYYPELLYQRRVVASGRNRSARLGGGRLLSGGARRGAGTGRSVLGARRRA